MTHSQQTGTCALVVDLASQQELPAIFIPCLSFTVFYVLYVKVPYAARTGLHAYWPYEHRRHVRLGFGPSRLGMSKLEKRGAAAEIIP